MYIGGNHSANMNLEVNQNKEAVVPYNSIIAVGDFVVVSEEDLL